VAEIFLIEDEDKVGKITLAFLEEAGFGVRWFKNGEEGWDALQQQEPDLLILDLRLPGKLQGTEICRELRRQGSALPVIMLTAYGEEQERVQGLELGADDYLVKPFSLRELVARIKALLRRSGSMPRKQKIVFSEKGKTLTIDPEQQEVFMDDRRVELTSTEFRVLIFLARNPDHPFSREELLHHIHGPAYEGFDRVIDAHIKNIRKKLNLESGEFIQTRYGQGYKFRGRPAE